ncbi:MAG: MFS transporter [Nitrospirae bacterium]|nr:MFS transporter [Nitrospirota bacterium]
MSGGRYTDLLKNFGFLSFLMTQFLGAFNDNLFKMVVSLFAVETVAKSGGGSGYLSLVGAFFILPFLLFSGYSGYVSDVFNKRSVIIGAKGFEIVAMVLALFAFRSVRIEFMLVVLFLVAVHSTFFSPAKYGIVPEMLPYKDLSRANGLLEMTTFLAIILGTAIGSLIFAKWRGRVEYMGFALIVIAVTGTLASTRISKVPTSGSKKAFRLNPWGEIITGIKRLYEVRPLWLTVVGISYFWFLGALLQMLIILFGKELMHLNDQWIGLLVASLAIGIGAGSIVAGRLSGDSIEPGLVPAGSIGMGLFSILLSFSTSSFKMVVIVLILMGFSGGLFIVPMNAYLQQASGQQEKGRLIATNNFLNMAGVLLSSGALWLFRDFLQIQANKVILIFGFVTFIVTAYIVRKLPGYFARFVLWIVVRTIYRVRITGYENVPLKGPVLLISNHVSFVDALLIGSCTKRFVRFMIARSYYNIRWLQWFFKLMGAIPVSEKSRKDLLQSIAHARNELREGNPVCLFAEGEITRTGNILPFKKGFERIVEGLDVPVIPVHLDRVWGSMFSFSGGRFLRKLPHSFPHHITISFGRPMQSDVKAYDIRQAVVELGSDAVRFRRVPDDLLHLRFMKNAKRNWFSFCMADFTGRELNYGKTLTASILLASWIKRNCSREENIGILLPASVGGAIANIAVQMAAKVSVNLNFTSGNECMSEAIRQCSIKTIISSRKFIEAVGHSPSFLKGEESAKLSSSPLPLGERVRVRGGEVDAANMVFLEDIMQSVTSSQKIISGAAAFLLPYTLLKRLVIRDRRKPDDLAAVICSSGSTGIPKGVMLSHHNLISNIEGFSQVFHLTKKDKVMGVLPFFHSFGFTATLWFPLVIGFGAVYHANPLDAKTVGEMTSRYKATILLSTPTFCSSYIKKCDGEDFSSLRYAIVGAEKLQGTVAAGFKEKFGIDLMEGYGCTEMGPVVSVNMQNIEHWTVRQCGNKPGTVGHPIPGVAAKVVDIETGEPLGNGKGQEGMLLIKGQNRMIGYLGQPEKTRDVLKDGWYITGDIASIDEDGFIMITDRLSRFSKIGGEMVPHVKIEETISGLLGNAGCFVTAVTDSSKGERLVVLHTDKDMNSDDIWKYLCRTDLPRLWIPRRDNIYYIETIPTLGSGKVDMWQARSVAIEMSKARS